MKTYTHAYPDYEGFGEESPPVIPISERPKAGKPLGRKVRIYTQATGRTLVRLLGALGCLVVVGIVVLFQNSIDK
ncbi:MAG: hypothetical protein V4714_17770 [Bacteroidota bacterium]